VGNAKNVADIFRIRFGTSAAAGASQTDAYCSRQIAP
jgi:hypothetical protein